MSDRDTSCEKRIDKELESTIESLRAVWESYCAGEEEHKELGSFYDYGLSFDYVAPGTFEDQDEGYFRYQLSWGGPSDEFRFYTCGRFDVYKVEYRFMDWFDGACRTLYGEDKELLLEIFEWFKDVGSVESEYEEAVC